MGSLNVKGIRERALKRQLEKYYNKIRYVISKNLTVGHYLAFRYGVVDC
jgi:hypothetical protein